MIDTGTIEVGCLVETQAKSEYGDGIEAGLMVVDIGVTGDGEQYVIVLDCQPSGRGRTWLYSKTEGLKHYREHGLLSRLRRLYVSELGRVDDLRDATRCTGYSSKALLSAGLEKDPIKRAELVGAYFKLMAAVNEIRAAARGEGE